MSATEYQIGAVQDAAGMLRWLYKRVRMPSLHALIIASGVKHNGLVSFATGTRPAKPEIYGL